jgi:hypothetical protein
MNPTSIKLFLTLLWFVSGVGFLIHDLWTGHVIGLPFAGTQIPLWVPFLLFAAFNFVRWWAMKSRAITPPAPRHRPHRRQPEGEPDPTFRFDEPPPEETGRDT